MQIRKNSYLIPILLGAFVIGALLLFWPTAYANAQCGSQASSCKNCHEVQGKDPVNNDGTGWHEAHAFGDFCEFCHGGNAQSMVEADAHANMVKPLDNVQASCGNCHPQDTMEKAKVYASALGVQVNEGGGGTGSSSAGGSNTGGSSGSAGAPSGSEAGSAAPGSPSGEASSGSSLVVEGGDIVDYTQQYNATVLGKREINWGNIILIIMILGTLIGGGSYVFWNERRLRGVPTGRKAKVVKEASAPVLPQIQDIPPEVVALLPKIAELNPVGLRALQRLLENPEEASELLHSLSRLDPDLVRRIRNLDRESRALLMALSGD